MTTLHDPNTLPADLPAPQDDGAARHLTGMTLPSLVLKATDGSQVDLSKLPGRTVIYIYPRTGVPGQPLPEGWNEIPGARGCTPQSCGFRDHFSELKRLGSYGFLAYRPRILATSAKRSTACTSHSRCSPTNDSNLRTRSNCRRSRSRA